MSEPAVLGSQCYREEPGSNSGGRARAGTARRSTTVMGVTRRSSVHERKLSRVRLADDYAARLPHTSNNMSIPGRPIARVQ